MNLPQTRCINIDWLEVHCIEPLEPRDADYYRSLGFEVSQREYGTRVYEQMFTIYTPDGQPFMEVRRAPHTTNAHDKFQVLEVGSCHLKLHNRACYYNNAGSIMRDFLKTHRYEFRRISRIDICLDFEKFDSGDMPATFVRRLLEHKYAKVNQTDIAVRGKDLWDGKIWNSLSWGSKKSSVFTRFYNKTLELKEVKDKPYIRQAWASSGLVDDFIQLTKRSEKGIWYKPDIWRLEFSIQSSVKNWVCFDVDENGDKTHYSVRNDLDRYATRDDLLQMFASLVNRYFHFKKIVYKGNESPAMMAIRDKVEWTNREKQLQRKDRCPDKELFRFKAYDFTYKVEKVATAKADCKALIALRNRIQLYRESHYETNTRKACDCILASIEREIMSRQAVNPHDESEMQLLQRLIASKINGQSCQPITQEKEFIESLLALPDGIF